MYVSDDSTTRCVPSCRLMSSALTSPSVFQRIISNVAMGRLRDYAQRTKQDHLPQIMPVGSRLSLVVRASAMPEPGERCNTSRYAASHQVRRLSWWAGSVITTCTRALCTLARSSEVDGCVAGGEERPLNKL